MTENAAKFVEPLLYTLGFNKVTISESIPSGAINLSAFRSMKINTSAGDLRSWYYSLVKQHLPQDFSRPLFNIPQRCFPELFDKILLIHTSRAQNYFVDQKQLEKYKDRLMFIGLKSEYEDFQKNFFDLPYLPVVDALDCAKKMISAKGIVGNQSGLFTLAEMLKVPRVLISPEFILVNNYIHMGPVNNLPIGGWFEVVRINEKLCFAVEELIKK